MKNVIFIAPPATGKGTLSKYLVDQYGYNHISTGDLLRNVAKENTEMGKCVASLMEEGKFIGDEIILPLFKEELIKLKDKPFILDGMPRTTHQAEYLTELFTELSVDNYVVINMDIDEESLKKRATGRRICGKCKRSYNIYFEEFKPQIENICDDCNSLLMIRDDDTEETFYNRYQIYLKETSPLITYYKEKEKLVSLNANQANEKILNDLDKIIKGEPND